MVKALAVPLLSLREVRNYGRSSELHPEYSGIDANNASRTNLLR